MSLKNILTVAICVVCFFIGGIAYKKIFGKDPERGDSEMLRQIKTIKELHTIKCFYDDMMFIHRKDDPSRALWAIIKVPVRLTAYTNLEEVDFVLEKDTLSEIILPHAVLSEPNYLLDSAMTISVRRFQFHAGSNNYVNTIRILKERIKEGKISIKNSAVSYGVLSQADQEAEKYFKTILALFGKQNISVRFAKRADIPAKADNCKIDSLNRIVDI